MSQVEMDQDFDEQLFLAESIITPEHSYCKSPQYTADECDEDIQNQIENETQSDLNEFKPPVPLIKSGKLFPTHLFDD